jgi:thymidylate kinase
MNNKFLKYFFDELNKEEISYCVLRNYEGLPDSLNGSDLDILVSKDNLEDFYTILDRSLDLNHGKIIVKYGKVTPRICVAGISNNQYYGIQFDVHENILPYQTNNMFPVEFLLKRANRHNDILVANDNDAKLIAFFKEILNNGICKEKYFNDAKESWFKSKDLYEKILLPIYDEKFISLLNIIFENDYSKSEIYSFAKYGQKVLKKDISIKITNLESKLSRFYRFFNPPGFTVAMLGTDGAGKTTIIDLITEPLNEAVHNALYYEHMRPNLVPNIAQLFGKKKQEGPMTNPHAAKPSGALGSLLRLFYYSFDYIFGYLLKVYPVTVKKSSIWIFDRYYYDYMIDPKRARINLPSWVINIINIFIPRPDLILCFGADPKVIYSRKPELPLDEITIQVNKLKEFSETNDKAVWIDTEKSIEKSVEETFITIVNKMSDRYN